MSEEVRAAFHRDYYGRPAETWQTMTWLGVPLLQQPLDLWIVQELIAGLRPSAIIETGTFRGGSALYYATVCDAVARRCRVVTVDREEPVDVPLHPRISYVTGDSVTPDTVARVTALVRPARGPCLVLLDSDHSAAHVLAELRAYSPLVTPGSYLICQDTNLGHEVVPDFGPGPAEAVAEFLAESDGAFEPDPWCERLGMTFFPGGWLRRVK